MTDHDHTDATHGDAFADALRSPALPFERAHETAVLAKMADEVTTAHIPSSPRRHRHLVAFAAVTVASFGVGGIIAAGPGGFRPFIDDDKPPASPVFDDSVPVPAPDDLDADVEDVDDDLEEEVDEDLDGDVVDEVESDLGDDADDDLDDDVSTDRITTDPDFVCAAGDNPNHGQTVSSAAKAPGPNNAAAHSRCGKPVGASSDNSNGNGGTDRITTDSDFVCAAGDNANHGQTVSSAAKAPGSNNAAAHSQCGKPVGSGSSDNEDPADTDDDAEDVDDDTDDGDVDEDDVDEDDVDEDDVDEDDVDEDDVDDDTGTDDVDDDDVDNGEDVNGNG